MPHANRPRHAAWTRVLATLVVLTSAAACSTPPSTATSNPATAPAPSAPESAATADPAARAAGPAPDALAQVPPGGAVIESQYSKMIVQARGTVRTLLFERDNGQRVIESQMDVARPHELLVRYTRTMFASYLLVPKPERVLIIGVGAGSMIRFLQHYDPQVAVEAVDIDPMVIEVAGSYFGTRPSDRVKLVAADGFAYLREGQQRYDVIYMDAFLKPSMSTDSTGVPLRLKTLSFYEELQGRLTDTGIVVFNLNLHPDLQQDIDTIRDGFPSSYLFTVPGSGNFVMVGSKRPRLAPAAMRDNATQIRATFDGSFDVTRFLDNLRPDTRLP